MKLFDVYPLFDIQPTRAEGCFVWDNKGVKYLDLYGGHAVISVGHSHPEYVKRISNQLSRIAFYSNSVQNPLQEELASKLGNLSDCNDYQLFLCNSGAEANENALKLASFVTGRKKIISYTKGFHGRTSAAVAITDNPKIVAPVNQTDNTIMLPFNDLKATLHALEKEDVAAVIIEGIQGIGGIHMPDPAFLKNLAKFTKNHGALLILDEIQSGYGRSGKFFAYQHTDIRPDLVTMAKGMGNGFPIGGVLIHPSIKAWHGMLGTTFGGNHLACAAGIAVLEVMDREKLITNAEQIGTYLMEKLSQILPDAEVRGKGLMIGVEFKFPIQELRKKLLFEHQIFTGVSGKHILRLLPPLSITKEMADQFIESFLTVHQEINQAVTEQ